MNAHLLYVPIGQVHVQEDFNARINYGEDDGTLDALIEAIRTSGRILQPLTVRLDPEADLDGYLLVAGHRRLRAAQALGMAEVPVLVTSTADSEILDAAMENLSRRDLCDVERAQQMQRLRESGLTVEAISKIFGFARETVFRALRLLELPGAVQNLNVEGKLRAAQMAEFFPLLEVGYPKVQISALAQRAADSRASAATIREAVNQILAGRKQAPSTTPATPIPAAPATVRRPGVTAKPTGKGRPPRVEPTAVPVTGAIRSQQVTLLRRALNDVLATLGSESNDLQRQRIQKALRECDNLERRANSL